MNREEEKEKRVWWTEKSNAKLRRALVLLRLQRENCLDKLAGIEATRNMILAELDGRIAK